MNRIEGLFARLGVAVVAACVALALVETAATYYLWNVASEEDFLHLASINQIKARYGDDFFIDSKGHKGFLFTPHHYLGYRLTPNYARGTNRHNALGFRGEEISFTKPDGVYRIVAVGGSTTYSVDVDDFRESYPHYLAERLTSAGMGVEVINAGVGGYSSYQNLINIQFRILPLQPDLLIIYQGINDIHPRFVYPFSAYRGDNSGYVAPFVSHAIMPDIVEYSTALRIAGIRWGFTKPHTAIDWHRHTAAQNSHRDRFLRQWRQSLYPSGIFTEVSAMEMLRNNPPIHFERNLRHMIAAADAHDVDVLLLTFVTSPSFDDPVVASDEYKYALAEHNEVTRRLAASTSASLFDLSAAFPDDPALFTDGRHMTAEGNRVRARLIGAFVIDEFLS